MRLHAIIIYCSLLIGVLIPVRAANDVSPQRVELKNNRVILTFSENAELISCINPKTGKDIAATGRNKIARIKTLDNRTVNADRIDYKGRRMRLFFGKEYVDLNVQTFDDYMTFEVVGGTFSSFKTLVFLDLKMDYDYTEENAFLAVGAAMTLQTDPVYYPSGEDKRVQGRCTAQTGMKGAKLVFVACGKNELRSILKEVYQSPPAGAIPLTNSGGPFALDNQMNYQDCVILAEASQTKVGEWIDFYSNLGIRQVDFELGGKTFIQGQFTFPMFESAAAFKRDVADPLYKAGIISSLHTYSHYIAYNAEDILSNPKWQQQLEFRESFVLKKAVSTIASVLDLEGEVELLKGNNDFWSSRSPFILIDKEIIRYSCGADGTVTFQRGQCGTKAAPHKSGSLARIIGGRYSHIAPKPCSDLFYEIAHRTAKAYNEGGFRGLYFDALEGLSIQLRHMDMEEYMWYYAAEFVNEVTKYCKVSPIVEYSCLLPTLWSARGRGGAWDTPNRGYKRFIDKHLVENEKLNKLHYVTTLGWFNLYPHSSLAQGDYATKYLYTDDVDYLGAKSIAFDQTMVYEWLKESDLDGLPALKRNLDRFSQYNDLRRSNYFSNEVKAKLQNGAYEYKLEKIGDEWAFLETIYCREKIHGTGASRLAGQNPFKKQTPFIRLENLYSSDGSNAINLVSFDDNSPITSQNRKLEFMSPLNLKEHRALKLKIKGNGSASKDAVCIRLVSSSSSGFADFVIKTNFSGWRDVVLPNLDNAEYEYLDFDGMDEHTYKLHKYSVDFSHITSLSVFLSGECKGVAIKQIDAVPLQPNAIINPTVRLGRSYVRFQDTLQSGEYIEYNGGGDVAQIYDRYGNKREVQAIVNRPLIVNKGGFEASVTGSPQHREMPMQVVMTFGLFGEYVRN